MEDEFRSKRLELAGEAAARVLARNCAAKVIEKVKAERAGRRLRDLAADAPLPDCQPEASGRSVGGGRGGHG